MFQLTVRKVGNSVGVTIPTTALAQLGVRIGDSLFLTESPDGFRVTPYDPDFEEAMRHTEEFMANHRNALRELAK